eukprot:TRINITY_DN4776_c5_g1_i1.p1 TRINITY_DN4776_c5_g1~~TRINITY_DN4776_c5_g1_i1.p1  ORF type:complete len:101 (+),score=0.30 TRINITY_DN4776_c5_g1_i1:94-396(+)
MFDSVVYSWVSAFNLSRGSTLLLQNNNFCFISNIINYSQDCVMIMLGGNDTHGYAGNLFASPFKNVKLVIVRNAEEFEALMTGKPINGIALSRELRQLVC